MTTRGTPIPIMLTTRIELSIHGGLGNGGVHMVSQKRVFFEPGRYEGYRGIGNEAMRIRPKGGVGAMSSIQLFSNEYRLLSPLELLAEAAQ